MTPLISVGGKDIENSLHDLARKMPQCNYETLKSLIKHFVRVLQHSNKNQLTASSLGERWGGVWITLLPALVEHFDTIFKDGQEIDSGPCSQPLSGEKEGCSFYLLHFPVLMVPYSSLFCCSSWRYDQSAIREGTEHGARIPGGAMGRSGKETFLPSGQRL